MPSSFRIPPTGQGPGTFTGAGRSPNDQDRAVGEVYDLVRGAAEDEAGQVAAARSLGADLLASPGPLPL